MQKTCIDPHRCCYFDLKCADSGVVLQILALPACTTGKLCDQLNPAKFSTDWDTVLEVKGYISGEKWSKFARKELNLQSDYGLVCPKKKKIHIFRVVKTCTAILGLAVCVWCDEIGWHVWHKCLFLLWGNCFLLFFGKEWTNMAVTWGAQGQSKKKKKVL